MNKNQYVNREISWLRFNERVLQESVDVQVPLIERLRFLGIFSNNLDEFFKVRYATVKRIVQAGKSGKSVLGGERAKDLLDEITSIVIRQQKDSQVILKQIEQELEKENIFLIDETEIQPHQEDFLKTYFIQNVGPSLMTIILNSVMEFPTLKD
ncbi:MAG: polyphosphate kinase 1, partial [Robiginitalea sp.]